MGKGGFCRFKSASFSLHSRWSFWYCCCLLLSDTALSQALGLAGGDWLLMISHGLSVLISGSVCSRLISLLWPAFGASEHQAVAGRLHNCTAVSQTPANWKRCRLMWHERSWSAENNASYNAFRRNGLLWISCIFFGRSPVSWRTGSRETIFWLLTAFLQ